MAVVSQTPPGTGDGAWQRPAPDAWWGKKSFNCVPPSFVPPHALLLEVCSVRSPRLASRGEKNRNGKSPVVALAIRRDVWGAHACGLTCAISFGGTARGQLVPAD
jgi:hypothetical protein